MKVPKSIWLSMFKRNRGESGLILSFMLCSSRSGQPKSLRPAQSLKVALLQWKRYPVSPESSLPSRTSGGGLLPPSSLAPPATAGAAGLGLACTPRARGGGALGGFGAKTDGGPRAAPTGMPLLLLLLQSPDCTGGGCTPLHFARKAIGCFGRPGPPCAGFLGTAFPFDFASTCRSGAVEDFSRARGLALGTGVAALALPSCFHGAGFFGAATPAIEAGAGLAVDACTPSCGPGVNRARLAAGSWTSTLTHFLISSSVSKRPCLFIAVRRADISLRSRGPGLQCSLMACSINGIVGSDL
mmetsp:Transcript_58806/g.108608  ORF Transcript_58806/g.108608 Transcript_58806/m.108608 type:complete len:299 (+) Transcript_58806:1035-1931(+)